MAKSKKTNPIHPPPDKTHKIKDSPWTIIDSLRAKKGISKKHLAEKLDFSYGYLVDLLNGRYPSKIDNQTLETLAQVLEIPLEQLVLEVVTPARQFPAETKTGPTGSLTKATPESLIPIIPLNSGTLLGQLTDAGLEAEEVTGYLHRIPELKANYAFAIKLQDESMSPPCRKGTIFVVNPQQSASINEIVLVILKNGRGWLGELKQQDLTQILLKPYNPKYTTITLENKEIAFIYPTIWLLFPSNP